jgi:hypothetical protein
MLFPLLIAQCEVQILLEAEFLFVLGEGYFRFLIFQHSNITKISLDFKTNIFVFRGIGVFLHSGFFVNFV